MKQLSRRKHHTGGEKKMGRSRDDVVVKQSAHRWIHEEDSTIQKPAGPAGHWGMARST
jgi:hypothetical protein